MRIAAYYSHPNGWEYLQVHHPGLWKEIEDVVTSIDASVCRTKRSNEKSKRGRQLYSPIEMNARMRKRFRKLGWVESRVSYWVTRDVRLVRQTMHPPAEEQKKAILKANLKPIFSYNQTDFVKNRVAVEVQFGKYSFVAYDLFVKHLAFYVGDTIDVGVEVVPMKELQEEKSSGVGYYEAELYNLIREGRGVPAVPLVLVGVAP